MTVWNPAFEASPSDTDYAKYGAGKIRELKTAVSERGELEHNWKTGTQPFHKAGKCSVVYVGTTAQITALTGMSAGSIAFDTGLSVFKIYTGTAWTARVEDHGQLSGLSDDDHPQYLSLTKASQSIAVDVGVTDGIKIDGRDISVDGAALDLLVIRQTKTVIGAKGAGQIVYAGTENEVHLTEITDVLGEFTSPNFIPLATGFYSISARVRLEPQNPGDVWYALDSVGLLLKVGSSVFHLDRYNVPSTTNQSTYINGYISLKGHMDLAIAAGVIVKMEVIFTHSSGLPIVIPGDVTYDYRHTYLSIHRI